MNSYLGSVEFVPLTKASIGDRLNGIVGLSFSVFGTRAWTKEHFLVDLPSKWLLSCLAIHGNEIIGCRIVSSYRWNDEFIAHAHFMATERKYQGHGIGSQLLAYSHQLCKSIGIWRITTETTDTISPNLGFYEKNGYTRIIDHGLLREYFSIRSKDFTLLPEYFCERAIIYQKELI